ncbi:hypothetical protein HK102_013588 [Quaeritorhiza haematococci]|nr:hypothetical protein HK102_013588 [Quaeritorhiza haematococci]
MLTAIEDTMDASPDLATPASTKIDTSLLSPPHQNGNHDPDSSEAETANANQKALARTSLPYENRSNEFLITQRCYTQQYSGIYFSRLTLLRKRVLRVATERWKKRVFNGRAPQYVERILDVPPGQVCFVAGTIYAEMPLKPNVLDELAKETSIVMPPPNTKYVSEKDTILLEDESGRLVLTGQTIKDVVLVTGVVIGALGRETNGGQFEVLDICYPDMKPQSPLSTPNNQHSWIAFASGLSIGDGVHFDIRLQMFMDYLLGELGNEEDQSFSANVVRLVIAGNSLAKPQVNEDDKKLLKKFGSEYPSLDSHPTRIVDVMLSELCSGMPVDVMPGNKDPTNCALPQQPMHFAMFPKSCRYSTFNAVTNPYAFELGGASVIGTSGQTIDDIFRYVGTKDRIRVAAETLNWAHLAPTAPDTLWCYPFKDADPFIIPSRPHVYFVGNQPSFATELVKGPNDEKTRVVLVPSFAETSSMVLVNLSTLDCKLVTFRDLFSGATPADEGAADGQDEDTEMKE